MEMTVRRVVATSKSTIGDLTILGGSFHCYTLEDVVRTGPKVWGETAIPAGRYEVIVNFSARFRRPMPLLLAVPGFEGIRIHDGNDAADTDGCILVGQTKGPQADWIGSSVAAFNGLFPLIATACHGGKVFITIQDVAP